jgi:tetratricopeptide (TPR) repeat protein
MESAIRRACVVALLAVTAPSALQPRPSAQQRPEADLCAVPPGSQPLLPAKILEGQGVTDMPVTTTSAEARRFFNQGVSQVHSFWFLEAERSFLQAATLDPDMAMAYWGIAVAAAGDHRPTFQSLRDPMDGGRPAPTAAAASPDAVQRTANGAAVNPQIRAREAIAKAMALRDKVTPRERLYIEAQAARRNPGSKTADADFIAGMRALVAAFPDDLEAKSILGLALLNGYDSVTRAPRAFTTEGTALLEEVVAKDDKHFGAHHYLIHGWEGSATPERAWRACKRYPELVPNIPHALHMPGHIYAQSDRIDDAIKSFADAADNELKWMGADVLYPNGHHGHNVHFLVQALNLDGRLTESLDRVRHMMSFKETPRERAGNSQRTPYRQGYYALVKTLVRFEQWNAILDGTTVPVYDKPEQQAWRTWGVGLAYAATGKLDQARATLEQMKKHVEAATASRRPLSVAQLELEATIAARGGDKAAGYEQFRKAADQEAALLYTEPPSYPRPVVEGWGATALALGDHGVAEKAYREALTREPGSGRAYFALAAILKAQNQADAARQMYETGIRAWDKADKALIPGRNP